MKPVYVYRRRLPHYQRGMRPLFITFRKWSKDPFTESERSIILQHCLHDDGTKMLVHAVVVMPEHVHMLITALHHPKGRTYSLVELLQPLKSASAHSLNKLSGHGGPVWQDESFDHVLRSDESFRHKIDYIQYNPVRRGLVPKPEDYKWLWIAPNLVRPAA